MTIQIAREKTRYDDYMGYSFRLVASYRQSWITRGTKQKKLNGCTTKDRSDDPSHHERTFYHGAKSLSQKFICQQTNLKLNLLAHITINKTHLKTLTFEELILRLHNYCVNENMQISLFQYFNICLISVVERSLMVRWIVRSILHSGHTEQFLVATSATRLSVGCC